MSAVTYGLYMGFAPLLFMMGIRDWSTVGALLLVTAALGLSSLAYSRRQKPSSLMLCALVLFNTVGVLLTARIFGPFVITPALAVASTLMYLQYPGLSVAGAVVPGCLAVALPFVFESLGLWRPSYAYDGSTVTILANAVNLPMHWTVVTLLVGSLASIVIASYSVFNVRLALRRAERRNLVQTWQLRQLIPDEARTDGTLADESLRPPG